MLPKAYQLILDDHAALGAVLRALRGAVDRTAGKPQFDELRAMLFFLDDMPARVHHASENNILFPRIRERCPALRPVLDRLQAEHDSGEAAMRELEHALTAWQLIGDTRRESLQLLVQAYAAAYLGHMEVEESYVLPVAVDYLSPADWRELEDALAEQRRQQDEAVSASHRALLERITSSAFMPK